MYSISRITHEKHGKVVEISRDENGSFETPFWAVEKAKTEKRLWLTEGAKKVKFLVDNKILTLSELESWGHHEYQTLPKCYSCAAILKETVFTHKLCGTNLFCSQDCADKDFVRLTEVDNDESEFECL